MGKWDFENRFPSLVLVPKSSRHERGKKSFQEKMETVHTNKKKANQTTSREKRLKKSKKNKKETKKLGKPLLSELEIFFRRKLELQKKLSRFTRLLSK